MSAKRFVTSREREDKHPRKPKHLNAMAAKEVMLCILYLKSI